MGAASRCGSSSAALCGASAPHAPDCAPSVYAVAATTHATECGLAARGTGGRSHRAAGRPRRAQRRLVAARDPPRLLLRGNDERRTAVALLRSPPTQVVSI